MQRTLSTVAVKLDPRRDSIKKRPAFVRLENDMLAFVRPTELFLKGEK